MMEIICFERMISLIRTIFYVHFIKAQLFIEISRDKRSLIAEIFRRPSVVLNSIESRFGSHKMYSIKSKINYKRQQRVPPGFGRLGG